MYNYVDIDLRNGADDVCSVYSIGRDNENEAVALRLYIPEKYLNCLVNFEFEIADGSKFSSKFLPYNEEVIFPLESFVMVEGLLKIAVIFTDITSARVIKPFQRTFVVSESINALHSYGMSYPLSVDHEKRILEIEKSLDKFAKLDDVYSKGDIDKKKFITEDELDKKGFVTEDELPDETDPTVSEWAKNKNKPVYSASEISYSNDDIEGKTVQDGLDNAVNYVVTKIPEIEKNIEELSKIDERTVKTIIFSSTEGFFSTEAAGNQSIVIGDFWDMLSNYTDSDISVGTEIKKIEVKTSSHDEWVDINEMFTVDGVPYHIAFSKVFKNESGVLTFAVISYLFSSDGYVYNGLLEMTEVLARITYYVD